MVADFSRMDVKQLLAMLVVAIITGSGIQLATDPRPDPFYGRDGAIMAQQLRLEMRELEARIRADMPPHESQERILHLEAWVRERDPTFRPPSNRFSSITSAGR